MKLREMSQRICAAAMLLSIFVLHQPAWGFNSNTCPKKLKVSYTGLYVYESVYDSEIDVFDQVSPAVEALSEQSYILTSFLLKDKTESECFYRTAETSRTQAEGRIYVEGKALTLQTYIYPGGEIKSPYILNKRLEKVSAKLVKPSFHSTQIFTTYRSPRWGPGVPLYMLLGSTRSLSLVVPD